MQRALTESAGVGMACLASRGCANASPRFVLRRECFACRYEGFYGSPLAEAANANAIVAQLEPADEMN